MLELSDLVDVITDDEPRTDFRWLVGGLVIVAIIAVVIWLAAPAIIDSVGERAERISDKAIVAAREESRAHALAEEGWGYPDAGPAAADSAASGFGDEGGGQDGDDWGPAAE